jgi:hypothetical protein
MEALLVKSAVRSSDTSTIISGVVLKPGRGVQIVVLDVSSTLNEALTQHLQGSFQRLLYNVLPSYS